MPSSLSRLLWLWLLVLLVVPARAQTWKLDVVTYPPGATIKDQFNNVLGFSGKPIFIDLRHYHTRHLVLSLSLQGYVGTPIDCDLSDSNFEPRLPPSGSIVLQPKNLWVRLRDMGRYRPWTDVAILLVGVVLVGVFNHRRRLRLREERLGRYEPEDGSDSLVMATLGRYRLVEQLGQGGMATVYKGVPADTLEEKDAVAVKVLSRKLADRQEFVARFRREVDLCRRLSHPAVVRLLDWGDQGGYLYLIMELMEGVTLREHLDRGRLPLAESLDLLDQVLAGVAYAHRQGVVHRDLKPENIMLTRSGKPKVMDFGLARGADSDKLTQTGAALGTPAYMAPEQIRGDELNPACDQFALGVTAFELFTGRLPFAADDPMQILFANMSDPAPAPSSLEPSLPRALDEAVLRMLEKDPVQRYPDLDQAREALRQAAQEPGSQGANM